MKTRNKPNKNQIMANKLDQMELSEAAREMINQTDFFLLHDLFSGCTEAMIEAMAQDCIEAMVEIYK